MTLRNQLSLFAGVGAVVFLGLVGFLFTESARLRDAQLQASFAYEQTSALSMLSALGGEVIESVSRYPAHRDRRIVESSIQALGDFLREFHALRHSEQDQAGDTEEGHEGFEDESIEELEALQRQLKASVEVLFSLPDDTAATSAQRLLAGNLSHDFFAITRQMIAHERSELLEGVSIEGELAYRIQLVAVSAAGFLLLLGGGAIIFLRGGLLRPVAALTTGAEQLGRGNLAHRITSLPQNEFGLLGARFNEMAQQLETDRSSLQSKNEALARAYELQKNFTSMVSHELRTPLNSIAGFAEIVAESEDKLSALSRQNLDRIGTSAKKLLALINDILDFSKLEAGYLDVRPEPFALAPLLEELVSEARMFARGRSIEIRVEAEQAPARLVSDELRVRQILGNLLSNAVKYTDRGRITLRAVSAGEWVRLEVEDTGLGIPAEQQARIFEAFHQVDAGEARRRGGTGLGLSIVSRLTALLQGRLELKSQPGQGSCFSLLLPRSEPERREDS